MDIRPVFNGIILAVTIVASVYLLSESLMPLYGLLKHIPEYVSGTYQLIVPTTESIIRFFVTASVLCILIPLKK